MEWQPVGITAIKLQTMVSSPKSITKRQNKRKTIGVIK